MQMMRSFTTCSFYQVLLGSLCTNFDSSDI